MHPVIRQVTDRIRQRSELCRQQYIELMQQQALEGKPRAQLACGNLAHVVAACPQAQKSSLLDMTRSNVAIITAYNDMLSAHQPYADYPAQIKAVVSALGHSAQVAGGVPAMCDGVTQGQAGMDLSLFSATSSPRRRPYHSVTMPLMPPYCWGSAIKSLPVS